jgi:hypothetical protein
MPNEINTNDRFTAASHFFAEVNNISQSAGQTFGPVSADVFRLTAKFTAQAGTKAFAICPGIVAIQPQTGSTSKINLILRPYQQPIKGINIRYFIYRGLNRSDFIDTNGNIIPITSGVSDFIQKINTDFYDFHPVESPPLEFDAAFIGYRETIADLSAPMDGLFFSITQYEEQNGEQVEVPETAFELPKIDQGKSLGTFAPGECGIDVILQYGDYVLDEADRFVFDYNYARASEALIDLSSITDEVVRKRRKEQLFQFIDIAAFYGFHCVPEGKITTSGNVEHDQTTIYSQVLTPFASKNTYYLYIQSDRERSYDFYKNYRIDPQQPENMLYGTSEITLAARAYGTNGWPLILETTPQNHSETRNKIYLQLVTDNNPNVVLYGQTACVDNALRNHFSTIEELKQGLDAEENQPLLTNTIILSNPAVEDGSAKKHIANFGIVIYQGASYSYLSGTEVNEENETVNVYAQPNFFDDVFGNLGAVPLLKSDGSYTIILNERLLMNNYTYKTNQLGSSAVITLKVTDRIDTGDSLTPFVERVAYLTEVGDSSSNLLYPFAKPLQKQTSITSSTANLTGINEYKLNPPYYLKNEPFTDGLIPVNGLRISTEYSGNISDKILLGISKGEQEAILTSIEDSQLVNPRIFLIDLQKNGTKFMSKELIEYEKFTLAVTGENDSGELIIAIPEPVITIFSLEANCYFSAIYSQYVEESGAYRLFLNNLTISQ